jgi:glycosyltransferase involved in cell wall biosynthesis
VTPRLVTVAIPHYNTARFVGAAVASALAQTYRPIEIVVVDDGSPDDLDSAIAPYRDRIRVIRQANQGQTGARNRVIDETDGEFVAFLDADDRWQPGKVAAQVARMDAQAECGLVHTARTLVDGNDRLLPDANATAGVRHQGDCLVSLLEGNTITQSSVMVRRTTLGAERFVRAVQGAEDWDMWLRLAPRTRFAFIAEPLTVIRLHGSNMSSNQELMLNAELAVMERALERDIDPAARRVAKAMRRKTIKVLGHMEYERQNFAAARRYFQQAIPDLEFPEIRRLVISMLGGRFARSKREDGVRG